MDKNQDDPQGHHIQKRREKEDEAVKKLITLILGALVLGTQTSCATYAALTMPGPANDESVELGMHRSEVESVLGVDPSSAYQDHGTVTARYEYPDGPPAWSKLRSLLYVGGDVFTLFLSELIFWPIELHAKNRIQRVGTAEYDDENRLVAWTIKRPSGETLDRQVSSGPPTAPSAIEPGAADTSEGGGSVWPAEPQAE